MRTYLLTNTIYSPVDISEGQWLDTEWDFNVLAIMIAIVLTKKGTPLPKILSLFLPTMPQRCSDWVWCFSHFFTWSTMITNTDFWSGDPWTWISTQLCFSLVVLLVCKAEERHSWVLWVRQMKISRNNKIIFYLTSPSICSSKSPGCWICPGLHSFSLQTSVSLSPASQCTGLSDTNILRVLPQTQIPVKITWKLSSEEKKSKANFLYGPLAKRGS